MCILIACNRSVGDIEWTEQVPFDNDAVDWLVKFTSEDHSVKIRLEFTQQLQNGSEFCLITTTKNGKNLVDLSRSRKSNNLSREHLIRDVASLLGDETTADLKISVCSVLNGEKQVRVFCGHKAILSGIFYALIWSFGVNCSIIYQVIKLCEEFIKTLLILYSKERSISNNACKQGDERRQGRPRGN